MDVAVGWTADLPSHWRLERGKALFERVQREPIASDGVVTCFRDGVVTLRSRRRTTGFTESLKEIGYQGIRKGDLVIHAMDAFAGAAGVSDSDGKGTPVYSVCVPRRDANVHYYAAVVREMARSSWIQALSKGIRERSTDFRYETFATQVLPVPPVDEQSAIVKYLAHANARIGTAITAKRRLIELLMEEEKASRRAVMANIDAPILRAKDVCIRVIDCKNRTPEYVAEGRHHVVRTTCVRDGRFSMHGSYPTDEANFRLWTQRGAPQAGDVLFTREAPAGEAALMPERDDLCLGQRMMLYRPDPEKIVPEYLLRAIYDEPAREFISIATNGSTVGHLRVGDVGLLPIRVPSLVEQGGVVEKLRAVAEGTTRAVERIEREIALLQEFRTRLVADVVTGQVDVRGIASSLLETSEPVVALAAETDETLAEVGLDTDEWSNAV
ncbi:restriction endonuclease subunit S [Microbacterium sp. X-17]|uniref:restriction endonuclease subunit S n=1 Tax=Microbacterium sp. X-17 TaxID=3144404 RepID=UPI0031F4F16F